MNSQVLDAFALAIIAMDGRSAFPGLPPPDLADARDDARRIRAAAAELRRVAAGAGSYLSECDHALADWRRACWGGHWAKLDSVKRRYDPERPLRDAPRRRQRALERRRLRSTCVNVAFPELG